MLLISFCVHRQKLVADDICCMTSAIIKFNMAAASFITQPQNSTDIFSFGLKQKYEDNDVGS